MRVYFGKLNEVVTVTGNEQEIVFVRELEYLTIGSISWKKLPQERNIVTELLEQIAKFIRHIMIEQEFHVRSCASCRATRRSISPLWSS